MHHFRGSLPKWILTPQKEISCHIFKMAILTKFFDDLMNQKTREYAGKKMKSFLNVSPLTIVSLLLWPFKVASLYIGRQRCPYVQIFIFIFPCLFCFFPQFYIDPEIQFKWKSKIDKGEECWPFFEGLVRNI